MYIFYFISWTCKVSTLQINFSGTYEFLFKSLVTTGLSLFASDLINRFLVIMFVCKLDLSILGLLENEYTIFCDFPVDEFEESALLPWLLFLNPSKAAISGGGSRKVPLFTVVMNIGLSIFVFSFFGCSSSMAFAFGRRSFNLELTLLKKSLEGEYMVLLSNPVEGNCCWILLVIELYKMLKSSFGMIQFLW